MTAPAISGFEQVIGIEKNFVCCGLRDMTAALHCISERQDTERIVHISELGNGIVKLGGHNKDFAAYKLRRKAVIFGVV